LNSTRGIESPKTREVAAAFFVAGALILFQVSFSRLISYKLYYHYVFLAISLALLGLGAAGTYVAVARQPDDLNRSLRNWLACLALSVPIAFLAIANPIGVTQHISAIRTTKLLGLDAIAYLLWCSPFMVWLNFCGGVVLTSLFTRYSHHMGKLYSADLVGAGAGSLMCVGLMKYGSPPAAFVAAVIPIAVVLAPFVLSTPRRELGWRLVAGSLALTLGLCALIFLGPPWLRDFQNFRTEGGSLRKVIKYEWNHIIRTDHVDRVWYILDGGAATRLTNWRKIDQTRRVVEPAYIVAPPEPIVGIIGVGGGMQLAEALRARASRVLAVDINPTILRWVQNEDRALTNDLFYDKHVDIRLGEGRHVVRSSKTSFDVLVMHAIDTYAAAASGAYALTENFLYTREAFQDYFRALSDRGVLSISRWLFNLPRENLRLFSTALAALEELGVARPRDHLVMIAPVKHYERLGNNAVWGYLLMSKSPFSPQATTALRNHVKNMGWSILYAPDRRSPTPFDRLAHAASMTDFQAGYPYLVAPVTDSSPYLFQYYNPLHRTSYTQEGDWATANIYQGSSITLLVTLAACALLSFLAIIAPLLWFRRKSARGSSRHTTFALRHGLYFACLGLGFMAFEVPIIQVLSLYLGHPTYGFSVVLVALLISSGFGSLLVERLHFRKWIACTVVALCLSLAAGGVFPLVHSTLDLPDPVRFALAILLVGACGVPMGMPLALGVKELGRQQQRSVAWAWGINGAASVVGSGLVMIAMVFTSSSVALVGSIACYVLAAIAGSTWLEPARPKEVTPSRR